MIPLTIASEIRTTILDYLTTTFNFQDEAVEKALLDFLAPIAKDAPGEGLFKGPYVSLRLPFRKADAETTIPLEIRPDFLPYAHQLKSFERLSARDGRQPQPTIITTGTGSGKTECFLYPILDYCYAHRGEPGIKAIILYPMNALATDQSARLARMIAGDERLNGQISAGIYIGGESEQPHTGMGPDYLIDDRETLRKRPPDILLTNYKMLDFLLLRPEDKTLWAENTPETLRFLALDELHTYDGAQGSDVACLIRRLKARLNIPEGWLCPIGTSATVASELGNTGKQLADYASQIFDEPFDANSLIVENRLGLDEFIPALSTRDDFPTEPDSLAEIHGENYASYIERQSIAWFGQALTETDLAESLRTHAFLRATLGQLDNVILPLDDLTTRLSRWDPAFAAFPPGQQALLLQSFLALVAHARVREGDSLRPFLTCQVQLWVREISRLMRELGAQARFFWRDDVPLTSERRGFPAYFCRECGHSGWLALMREGDEHLTDDFSKIYDLYFAKSKHIRYVYPSLAGPNPDLESFQVCPSCLTITPNLACKACKKPTLAVRIYYDHTIPESGKQANDTKRCPACGTDGALSIVGSQAASLSSVAISHLYTSPLNQDKKLLAFTDSVQDASHRASFFEARTYRFNLRTAIQAALPAGQDVRLDHLTETVLSHWREQWKTHPQVDQRLVATFMPPDLRDLPRYQEFMDSSEKAGTAQTPLPDELLRDLKQRLSWEIIMEYGFTARLGRSLEKVGSSVAYFDPGLLNQAAQTLALRLPEEIGSLPVLSSDTARHFIQGLLERTRTRGGVTHDMLSRYAYEQGSWYFLTKKSQLERHHPPLLSPFHKHSPRFPRFLTDSANQVFDVFVTSGSRRTWYLDWAYKTLGEKLDVAEVNEIYRLAVDVLHQQGFLRQYAKANDHSYGLEPAHLWVTPQAALLKCDQCGHIQTVAAREKQEWLHHPCMAFRCKGHYTHETSSSQHYYREIYRRGQVERIFAHEHTGLLARSTREKVEREFKTQSRADATNLLAATPTLELGIDIGDLSSTMACSVPPAPANYLQRIGRAGRKTGNSLILTLANAQPHDLYFFEEPLEMMAGTITPPGCYLDAPDMLKRQFLAYCMDTWTATAARITLLPRDVSKMLAGISKGGFPENLLAYIQDHRAALIDGFMGIFGAVISAENQERLRAYFAGDELANAVREAIRAVEAEREELRAARKALKTRRDKVEADPAQYKDYDTQIKRIQQDMRLLLDMIQDIEEQYILNFFTDAGLLPNYAFPETGVKFEAVISGFQRRNDAEKNYEVRKYVRPAPMALHELAPSNHFYAEGHKLTVSHIDIAGREKSVERWQFCDDCSYMELVQASHFRATCPVCGSQMWSDQGQQHDMVRFRKAMAQVDVQESRVGDDGDDRERKTFDISHFFDIPAEGNGEASILPALPFGIQYHDQVTLREINFAPKNQPGQNIQIAGEDRPQQGFKTCRDCGLSTPITPNPDGSTPVARHTRNCASATTAQQIEWENIYLYRQVTSEAIRILLPVSTTLVEEKMATFEACLDLALRQRFQGSPDHLRILPHSEPSTDGSRRRFLVIYDTVQGGTGFLKELARPENFFNMLQMALDVLVSCRCRLNPEKQACYRCLYAYPRQRDLKLISRRLGAEMLSEILTHRNQLEKALSLSQIHLDSLLESELEQRFIYALGGFVKGKTQHSMLPTVYNGKPSWDFSLDGVEWVIEPQVYVGQGQGVSTASRADFVLWPQNHSSRPVAVFTDGFSYHAKPDQPTGRIGDDLKKRRAILASQKFWVWSVTWDDVKAFEESNKEVDLRFFGPDQLRFFEKNSPQLARKFGAPLTRQNAVCQLLNYLAIPQGEIWQQVGSFITLSLLTPPRPPLDKTTLQARFDLLCNAETEPELSFTSSPVDADCLYAVVQKGKTVLLELVEKEAIAQKRSDDFQIALRLNDGPAERAEPNFREDWNRFWLLTNLLQFLPGFVPVSTEFIRLTSEEPVAPTRQPLHTAETDAWASVFHFAAPELAPLLQECQQTGLPAPTVGYELMNESGQIVAMAESAWEAQKVCILLFDIETYRPSFTALGWETFTAQDAPSVIIQTIQARESQ